MWYKFSKLILRNRLIILITLGLITAFMAYRVQFVSMSYQLAQMLPKSDNTHIEYESFKSTFGKDGSVVVVGINNENIF
jgi:predicted RND superfamily exporter protein